MKRTLLTALTIPALVLGLGACSQQQADDAASKASSAASGAGEAAKTGASKAGEAVETGASKAGDAASPSTSAPAPVPAASRTMGAAPANAGDAEVKMTACKATDTGVEMAAEVKNTTDKKRVYILTGLAYDEKKKMVASAALMGQDPIEPGKSATITGKSSPVKAKGKFTCEVSEINSMPQD